MLSLGQNAWQHIIKERFILSGSFQCIQTKGKIGVNIKIITSPSMASRIILWSEELGTRIYSSRSCLKWFTFHQDSVPKNSVMSDQSLNPLMSILSIWPNNLLKTPPLNTWDFGGTFYIYSILGPKKLVIILLCKIHLAHLNNFSKSNSSDIKKSMFKDSCETQDYKLMLLTSKKNVKSNIN